MGGRGGRELVKYSPTEDSELKLALWSLPVGDIGEGRGNSMMKGSPRKVSM